MSRGQSKVSVREILSARQHHPTALGPLLASVAIHADMNTQSLADLLGVSETVVSEWAICIKPVPMEYVLRVGKMIGILSWLYQGKKPVFKGSQKKRVELLREYMKHFYDRAKLD